ncbi:OsmC family protein [Selenihalanaerobacter shriftii]|uniref:Putative redox protein n=1 Tax=Selenihalanaerobacter shriftii TaxID=142842 RepID=A0A1T4QGH2_9FIRM|nr:OsmC family protein [Selenihalanaerobacter shriftii]SKA02601.1 putative redox protein [Selenihalanaerobacter shriftii]
MTNVELNWNEEMKYDAKGDAEIDISIDGHKKEGANPPEIFLMGAASCVSIHLTMVLKKMRIELEDLNIKVNGERAEESPRYFVDIEFNFEVTAKDLAEEKMDRALNLAVENCGMLNTIREETNLTYNYEFK